LNNAETDLVNSFIGNNAETFNHDNIKDLVFTIGKEGSIFCPATFKNAKRSIENFDQLQLLTLEFDEKASFDSVKEKADSYDIPILFACDTPPSNGSKRFGVTFMNDVPVTDVKIAGAMLTALTTIFPEADPLSNDVTAMYCGGTSLLHFDEALPTIDIDTLIMNMSLCLNKRYGSTNYKRKIAEFTQKIGIALNGRKLPDISIVDDSAESVTANNSDIQYDKKSPNSTIVISGNGDYLSSRKYRINLNSCETEVSEAKMKPSNHRPYRSNDLKSLSSNCRLYREFESGSRLLPRHYFYYIKDRDIRACAGFCPYQHDCPHGKTYGQQ
jgi:hypothetical protein